VTHRLLGTGLELDDKTFEEARKWCFRYRLGEISASRFEREYRKLGFTRAVAYRVCYDIWTGNYEYVFPVPPPPVEEDWYDVLISVSVVTTSTKGNWAQRYFEVRLFVPILAEDYDKVTGSFSAIDKKCSDIDYLGDLFIKCIGIYMESKGYDYEMIVSSDMKYAGVMILNEFRDYIDRENGFYIEIWDAGSAVRSPPGANERLSFNGEERMGLRRFYNTFYMPEMYWLDLPETCRVFRGQAFGLRFTKQKEVRW